MTTCYGEFACNMIDWVSWRHRTSLRLSRTLIYLPSETLALLNSAYRTRITICRCKIRAMLPSSLYFTHQATCTYRRSEAIDQWSRANMKQIFIRKMLTSSSKIRWLHILINMIWYEKSTHRMFNGYLCTVSPVHQLLSELRNLCLCHHIINWDRTVSKYPRMTDS